MEPKLDDLAKDAADQIGGPLFRMFGALRRRLTSKPAPAPKAEADRRWEDLGQAIESDKSGLRERLLAAIRRRK